VSEISVEVVKCRLSRNEGVSGAASRSQYQLGLGFVGNEEFDKAILVFVDLGQLKNNPTSACHNEAVHGERSDRMQRVSSGTRYGV
jgi:hypothetical protein